MSSLLVPINADVTLDMGAVTETEQGYSIQPPTVSLFDQVVEWLDKQPAPDIGSHHWALGIGAAALCLRWGTWLGLLMDVSRPLDRRSSDKRLSHVSDSEMRRINIEASSNLARVLELWKQNPSAAFDLLLKAYAYLPMPHRQVARSVEKVTLVTQGLLVAQLSGLDDAGIASDQVIQYPYRALSNAYIFLTWRNGPIEDIHAGRSYTFDLSKRRLDNQQVRQVLQDSASQLGGLLTAPALWTLNLPNLPPWPERLRGLPQLSAVLGYPLDWTLTEQSAVVELSR